MSFPAPTENQAKIVWMALTAFAIALLIAILCAFVWGLGQVLHVLLPVLWPLAIAGILAYLLDPVVDFLQRRNVSRGKRSSSYLQCALLCWRDFSPVSSPVW